VQAAGGVATFAPSAIPILTTLGGYKFKATQPGLTPGKSSKFFVFAASTPSDEPDTASANDPFGEAVDGSARLDLASFSDVPMSSIAPLD
jgi:hypothetical protein